MKRKYWILAGAIASCAGLLSSVGQAAYISDHFSSPAIGGDPNLSGNGWTAGSGAIVSNPAVVHNGNAMVLPVLSTITNNGAVSAGNGIIWTDFWTQPVRLTAAAPTVDPNATAQVFVNSNGYWSTLSGNGSGVATATNVWSTLLAGSSYPTVNPGTWYHVGVLHDYVHKTWSLFVNELPIATNLGFIASGTGSITGFNWFQVQNLGGDASNVVWVDDFLVTNNIPVVTMATTNTAAGSTNGFTPAQSLTYYNVMGDPRPVTTNIGLVPSVGVNAVAVDFKPKPNQHYVLIGGASPTGTMSQVGSVVVDGAATSNFVADAGALSGKNAYFYKVVTVSDVDPTQNLTNTEVYVWYKQDRNSTYKWFFSGAPVVYGSSSDNTLSGAAGQQLALGTSGNSDSALADLLVVGDSTYYNNGSGWARYPGTVTLPSAIHLTPGTGVAIKRQGGAAGLSYSVLSGLWTNNVAAATLSQGWNNLCWPYDTPATAATCGFPGATLDQFVVTRNGQARTFIKHTTWGVTDPNDWPQPGEGFRYNSTVNGAQWAPVHQ